ncbi:MAG: flagellar type III secretion system pore protein FliP [Burkholderiaceae bacterium]
MTAIRAERPVRALLQAVLLLAATGLLIAPLDAAAQQQGLLTLNSSTGPAGTTYSVPVQTLLIFSALSFLPAMLLMMTSFTRIVIVLALIRQALGLQASPPNQVIVGMSLFLTLFVMGPTFDRIYDEAYRPFSEQRMNLEQAVAAGSTPLRGFMLQQTRESDVALFARIARVEPSVPAAETPMRVLIPAFVISELKTAFQIGFMVFVPFLLIDLIVASVLMSMGMMMLSPVLVALPFKLILFVLADGWNLLIGSLVASFG